MGHLFIVRRTQCTREKQQIGLVSIMRKEKGWREDSRANQSAPLTIEQQEYETKKAHQVLSCSSIKHLRQNFTNGKEQQIDDDFNRESIIIMCIDTSLSVTHCYGRDRNRRSSVAGTFYWRLPKPFALICTDPSVKSRAKKDQGSAARSLVCHHEFPRSFLVFNTYEREQMCLPFKSSLRLPDSRSISLKQNGEPIFTTVSVNIRKFACEQRDTQKEGDSDDQSIVYCAAVPFSIDGEKALSREFTIQRLQTHFWREELSFDRRPACLFTSIRPWMKIAIDVIRSNEISIWQRQLAVMIDTFGSASLLQGTGGCSITSDW